MPVEVHALMQDANDVNAVTFLTIKNQMTSDSIFRITLSNVATFSTATRILRDLGKAVVYHSKVTLGLVLAPGVDGVVPNGIQVGHGLWP